MKILVTGAAGYIGSILTPMLLQRRYRVVALDNFMYSQTSLLDCCHDPNLEIVRGDARDERLMSEIIKKVDGIIPLACLVGAPACDRDPLMATGTNLEAIRLILKLRKSQVIIYPNTNSGYGIGQEGIFCNEHNLQNPISLYGKLKVEAESEILSDGSSVALRLATVFGMSPRMRLDLLVNDFVYRAINDRFVTLFEAHFKRNYIHIRDVGRAFIHALDHFDEMNGQAYNVGLSNANLSKRELCQEIQKQIPNFYFHEAKIGEDPDKRNYVINNAKIEKTGFYASTSLTAGITELIKGFQIVQSKQFRNS